MQEDLEKKEKLSFSDIKKAFGVVWEEITVSKNKAVLLSITAVLSAVSTGLAPWATGRLIDAFLIVQETGSTVNPAWLYALAVWAGIMFVSLVFDWRLDWRAREYGVSSITNTASRWMSKLLFLPISFHKSEKSGKTTSKVQRASHILGNLMEFVLIRIGPDLVAIFIGIALAYTIHPVLASVLLVGALVFVVINIFVVAPLSTAMLAGNKAWNDAHGESFDALANVPYVKQSTSEKFLEKKITEGYTNTYDVWIKTEQIWTRINLMQQVAVLVTRLTIFALSVTFLAQGDLTIGGLVALNGYAMFTFQPLTQLARHWSIVQNGVTMIHEALKVMDIPEEQYKLPKGGEGLGASTGEVEFKDVHFAYPDSPEKKVLKGLSFKIPSKSLVALVGKSGVGKSTVIELIGGYYYPTKGEVLIDGVPTTKLSLTELRGHIAVVPQEPVLFNNTVEYNLKFGRKKITKKEIKKAAKMAHADDFIQSFSKKYKQEVGERGVKLSTGQKQRLAITRAILRDPDMLILDEPTSALDSETERIVTTALDKLMKDRTTIVIAHRLSTVQKADKIVVFDDGVVVEEGTHGELVKKEGGAYRNLHEHQIGLHE